MPSQASNAEIIPHRSNEKRRWHWPPYPFTFAVAGCVLAMAFVISFPAVEVSRPGFQDGKYGHHFELQTEYQHGWPAAYATRDSFQALEPPVNGEYWKTASAWLPWDSVTTFSIPVLLIDIVIWIGVVLVSAAAAQLWRSRRRSIWQLRIADFLGVVLAVGVLSAWLGHALTERKRELAIVGAAYDDGRGLPESRASFPAWLPASWRDRYAQTLGRVRSFGGDSATACQLPHLLVLQTFEVSEQFADHLRRMPQLEALDLFMSNAGSGDGSPEYASLQDLPSMPNLRGINLYNTGTTDADLAWLARCPRLECIELTGTEVGDDGLEHLRGLPRLRTLAVSGDRITDRGCHTLAQIASLEELSLEGDRVTDQGIGEFARLKNLRVLWFDSPASNEAVAHLRSELPLCSINGGH